MPTARKIKTKNKPTGYWTLARCKKEAKRFSSRATWSRQSGSSYNKALEKGWLEQCCSHMERKIKPNGFWTFEQCRGEALRFNSRSQWQRESPVSYGKAREREWMDKCTGHMTFRKRPNNYWNLRRCEIEAKKYETRIAFFRGSLGAYKAAAKNKWLDRICSHMPNLANRRGYTLIELSREAKKYRTRREFRKQNGKMHTWAYRNGFLDEICSHMIRLGNRQKRLIYVFEHPDKTAYIGLSYDPWKRREQHLKHSRLDTVGLVLREKNKTFGERQVFKVLPGMFGQDEAVLKERQLIDQYKKRGWTVLNQAKGGALGGNVTKLTLDYCLRVSRRYKKRSALQRDYPSVYNAIRVNRWQQICYQHMGKGKTFRYSDSHLITIIKKVKSITELREKYPLEYRAAYRRPQYPQWIKELTRARAIHTESSIIAAAKKCKSRKEFFDKFCQEYLAAKRLGIFEKIVGHMKRSR